MDDLKQIITMLSADEQKEFTAFAQRQKKLKSRKDLDLFKILQQKQSYKPIQIVEKLYPEDKNQIAYHAVRKRLQQQLIDFILLKSSENQESSALGLISLAKFLFDKRIEKLAWEFLKKAEKIALQNEQYDLLNNIYNLQIIKAESSFADPLDEIIGKRNANKILADEDEKANIANSLIKKQLQEIRQQGKELDFGLITKKILQEYGLEETVGKRPSLLYKLMTIARSAVLVSKDFYHFEPYLIEQYDFVAKKYGFSSQHSYYELHLLYMIAHVLYRNKKFSQSIGYLEKIKEKLPIIEANKAEEFYPRYVLLLAANYSLNQQTTRAIEVVEILLKDKKDTLNQQDSLNLIEMIAQYELKNHDLARSKIKTIEKNFADMLAQPLYKNGKVYLFFITQLIDNPRVKPEKLFKQTDNLFTFDPIDREDLQEIRFYAWLKAKLLKAKYQEVLAELVGRVG